MAAPPYPGNRLRTGRRGVSLIECVLALSVIFGFMFVTVRVMSFGLPTSSSHAAGTDTVAAKTDTPLLASENSDTRTP